VAETILVLDDDPINLKTIAAVVRLYGHDVLEATTAQEAIEICTHHDWPIRLFITDMMMPDKSGAEVAQEILESCPEIPVLFISGTPQEDWTKSDRSKFFSFPPAGVDFLEKPFFPSVLEERVRKLLGWHPDSFEAGEAPGLSQASSDHTGHR
jgi:CheY-like chemotaxis protein